MSKIEMTLSFDTFAEALKTLSILDGGAPVQKELMAMVERRISELEKYAAARKTEHKSTEHVHTPQVTTTQPQHATNGYAAPQAATGLTLEQVKKAFSEYVARGEGRTAGTAMNSILVPNGIRALKEATPEQYQALHDAFVNG